MTDPLIDAAGFTRADLDENARGRISEAQRAAIGGRIRRQRRFVVIAFLAGAALATIGALAGGARAGIVPVLAGMGGAFAFVGLMMWIMTRLYFGRVLRDLEAGEVSKVEGAIEHVYVSYNRGFWLRIGGGRFFSGNTALGRAMKGVDRARVYVLPCRVVVAAETL